MNFWSPKIWKLNFFCPIFAQKARWILTKKNPGNFEFFWKVKNTYHLWNFFFTVWHHFWTENSLCSFERSNATTKMFFSYSDIFAHLHPHLKKQIAKNAKNYKNFRKKMKFKMRLVAGNGIRPGKIRPEGPLNPQESSCKILWSHLKNSWKKFKKTYPPPQTRGWIWNEQYSTR